MNLPSLIQSAGYIGITAIVFAENGLLIGFFLPGDSLLFTAGFLASQGFFGIWWLLGLMTAAGVVGTSIGYSFGHRFGRRLFNRPNSRFFKQENILKAEQFYEAHGSKTIVLARFIPIVRTFAPIVAGVGKMPYGKFLAYNIIGSILWVFSVTGLGYWLGGRVHNIDHWLLPIIGLIILLSVSPGIYHMLRDPIKRKSFFGIFINFLKRKKG